jgi:plasmid replication initiation protein
MNDIEKNKQRYSIVVKSNDLIRNSRFSLSVEEQRIILYLISKINRDDIELLEYEFDIREFCEVCGIDYINNLTQLKNTIKALRDKSIWITLPNGVETTVSWIDKPYIYKNTGKIKIKLDKDMLPYLIQVKENFTKYELIAILALKSKFSLRLYELFKSYEYLGKFKISLDELRKMLMIENQYPKFFDFRRYVLDRAIEEIIKYTDLEVSYDVAKDGRRVSGIIFSISKAPDFDGEYHAAQLFLAGILPSRHKQAVRFKEFMEREEVDPNQYSLFGIEEK